MKKILASALMFALIAVGFAGGAMAQIPAWGQSNVGNNAINYGEGVNTASTTLVSLDINKTISLACDSAVTMTDITGYGKSTLGTSHTANQADCQVVSNSTQGYTLAYKATSNVNMVSNDAFAHTIVPITAGAWSVTGDNSGWGVATSSTYTAGNWTAPALTDQTLYTRGDHSGSVLGEAYTIDFGAEVSAGHIQPSGTYTVGVTLTATTL